jgi:hypothetical protein
MLSILTQGVRERSADCDASAEQDECAALRYQKVYHHLDPVTCLQSRLDMAG